jgi:S1-C subfamily serine protease
MIVGLRTVAALLGGAAMLMSPLAAAELPSKPEVRIQSLVREHAAGMKFASIESKGGETFRAVEISSVTEQAVKFRHAGGEGSLAAADCPELWRDLFGLAADGDPTSEPAAATGARTDEAVANAIAVIEGDRSNGTGFFCRAEGKVYLYTAAHVLSGNSKLSVKLRDGTVVRKFGAVEAAEGADLIRLAVGEEVPHFLEIAAESGVAKVGIPVLASGNAGGGGTVGFEDGKVMGVGPESIEIDAEVIQGNSGGPILHGTTRVALGVVTHLTAERKDEWAKETRFSQIRRFGCRLDRSWKWKVVPVDVFLKEGKAILAVQQQSELMIAALSMSKWSSPVFQQQRENPLSRDITALQSWMEQQQKGGQRFSETDRKKRLRGIFDSARHRSRSQMAAFKTDGFTWFHRESATQETLQRAEIDKVYESTVADLR